MSISGRGGKAQVFHPVVEVDGVVPHPHPDLPGQAQVFRIGFCLVGPGGIFQPVVVPLPEGAAVYFLRRKVGDVAVEIERLPRVGAGKPRRGQSAGGKHAATKVFVPLKGTVVGKPGSGSAHAGQPAEGTPLIGHRVNVGGPVAQDRHGKPRTVPQVRRGHAVLSAFPQNIGPYACQLCHGADPLQDLLLGQFGFQSLFSFL